MRILSVIMGVYNGEKRLSAAVQSILNQTYKDFEFIICDDASTDNTYAILENLRIQDNRIIIIKNEKNMGLAATLNNCLKTVNSEYIARMDDDDYSEPERLQKQIDFLIKNKNYSYVGCNVGIRQAGKMIGVRKLPEKPEIKDFLYTMPFIHPALMFRRNALIELHGYCEEAYCERCEDYDLLLRMASKDIHGHNLQEKLFDYEIRTSKTPYKHRINEVILRYKRFKELGLLPQALPYVVKPLAAWFIPISILNKRKEKIFYNGDKT